MLVAKISKCRTKTIGIALHSTVILLLGTSSAFAANSCIALLEHGIKDVAITTNSDALTEQNFTKFCRQQDQYEKDELYADANVEIFGGGRGGATFSQEVIEQRLDNWCSETGSYLRQNSEQFVRSETINNAAVKAFENCALNHDKGMVMNFSSSDDLQSVNINISWRQAGALAYGGVKVDGFRCTEHAVNDRGTMEQLQKGSGHSITNDSVAIVCNRNKPSSVTIDGDTYTKIPRGSISVITAAQYPTLISFSEKFEPPLPRQEAQTIMEELARLRSMIRSAQSGLALAESDRRRIEKIALENDRDISDHYTRLQEVLKRSEDWAASVKFNPIFTYRSSSKPNNQFPGHFVGCINDVTRWLKGSHCIDGEIIWSETISSEGGGDCGHTVALHICRTDKF